MKLKTLLFGKTYAFRDVKDVLAKANEPKSGVLLIGHGGMLADVPHLQFTEHDARGDALLRRFRRHPAKLVPRFFLIGLSHDLPHIPEGIGMASQTYA